MTLYLESMKDESYQVVKAPKDDTWATISPKIHQKYQEKIDCNPLWPIIQVYYLYLIKRINGSTES